MLYPFIKGIILSQTFLRCPGRRVEKSLLPHKQMLALLMQSKVQRISEWNTSGTQWQRLCTHFWEWNSLKPLRGQRAWWTVAFLSPTILITAGENFSSVSVNISQAPTLWASLGLGTKGLVFQSWLGRVDSGESSVRMAEIALIQQILPPHPRLRSWDLDA